MKRIIPAALAIGFFVGACVAWEAHSTYEDTCAHFNKEASEAARAPIREDSTQMLGFTPMDQFSKVYPPSCTAEDEVAETMGALAGGVFTALFILFAGSFLKRAFRTQKEH